MRAKYVENDGKDVLLCPKNGTPHKENINTRCDEVKFEMVEYAKIDSANREKLLKENKFDENGKSTSKR